MAETKKNYLKAFEKSFDEATRFLRKRDYHSLAELVKTNHDFTRKEGQAVIAAMYHTLQVDKKKFNFGYQLTGDQLSILAHSLKEGASLGKGDITLRFNYVARLVPEVHMSKVSGYRGYRAEFPDMGLECKTHGFSLKTAKYMAKLSLISYVEDKMLHAQLLSEPKYAPQGRSTTVKRYPIHLTLNDLFQKRSPDAAAQAKEGMPSRDLDEPFQV